MAAANPWLEIGDRAPFVLPADAAPIERFNRTARSAHLIHLQAPPEPFVGNPTAGVVLLNLNPRFDHAGIVVRASLPRFVPLSLANLRHASHDCPFFLLHPDLDGDRGQAWWKLILGRLIRDRGLERVARGVLVVELFPYRTEKFTRRLPSLASQAYGFDLVRLAVERDAIVVVMRGELQWLEAVPALREARLPPTTLRNRQRPFLSPGNLSDETYARILESLSAA
jgi:hypothetical protein